MNDLQFAYATLGNVTLPSSVGENLPKKEWKVASYKLSTIVKLRTAPDFMWVDLGKAPELSFAKSVFKHLAFLQRSTEKDAFIFISGNVLHASTYRALVEGIYETLPKPIDVVADLTGQPDLGSAIAKFYAQRKARVIRLDTPAKKHVPVSNDDLRSERGYLSIKAIAHLFGMDVIEIGRLIGRENKAALSKTPDAEPLQKLLQPYSDIALLRTPDFGDVQFRKWLNTPNEHMQNRSPMAWIREGRAANVAGFVYGILTGQPT